jgi:hypothetical protein
MGGAALRPAVSRVAGSRVTDNWLMCIAEAYFAAKVWIIAMGYAQTLHDEALNSSSFKRYGGGGYAIQAG